MENMEIYMLMPLLSMILGMGLLLIILKLGLNFFRDRNKNQVKNIDKSTYYRDIPCFESIDLAYWLLYNFSEIKKDDLNNGLLGAYLLDWYKKGYIDIKRSQKLGFKKDNYNIDLKEGIWEKSKIESKIYDFLKRVAGNNNTLEKNEIRDYCTVDANKFELNYMFESILSIVKEELEEQGQITVTPAKYYILFSTQEKITLSDELIDEYQNLNGLNNFLLDYSNMEEKMHIEVHIWENYLIFANLLGIANKVKQQFSKIYPNFNAIDSIFDISFDNTILGQLNAAYTGFKMQFGALIVTALLVVVLIFGNVKHYEPFLIALPFVLIVATLYGNLRKYFINKKVKEMDYITYAKITEVKVHYDTERDFETNRDITTKHYSFTYEYSVNGVNYIGYGYSKSKKKEKQRIKIYYNGMKPEKSETSEKHNHYLTEIFVPICIVIIAVLIVTLL